MQVATVILTWISAHQVLVNGAIITILDLLFALNPSTEANGVLHWIYLKCGGKPTP